MKPERILAGLFPLFLAFLFLAAGCARDTDTVVPGTGTDSSNVEDEENPTDPNDNDDGTSPPSRYSSVEACVEDCKATCTESYDACVEDGGSNCSEARTNCNNGCTEKCKPEERPSGKDPIKILKGMKSVSGSFKHCTHYKDALSVQNGTLSFVTQQGGDWGEYRYKNLSWWSWLWDWLTAGLWRILGIKNGMVTYFTFPYAAVGQSPQATEATKEKITIKINGTDYNWPQPGAVAFPLGSKVSDADLSLPTVFVPKVTIEGSDAEKRKKNYWVDNWNDYWGKDFPQMVVTYASYILTYAPINCEFTTEFTFHYFPKD